MSTNGKTLKFWADKLKGFTVYHINRLECSLYYRPSVTMFEAHIQELEQSTMIALTLFASQSNQIIIKILDLKDILGL